eukprot:CAMPEP_0201116726 /NCGR_PEP_ID=MMETSP0850-20130426/912_1 /ASSEMBLY_ACC=CAM_ASM_000622 /TAXON_ID=183588 /ORGANISM="Pseudo-nitzschia fraudulenta, Strain WWA7" /LENGTH=270 /DNA_ID=CAMNT_0047380877 /DNA_START=50 /DNA_END=859 /DNA_ORIENTATION=+
MPTTTPVAPTLWVAPSKAELPPVLCDLIVGIATEAIKERNVFSIALSGGSLPKFLTKLPDVFQESNTEPRWDVWHVFLADERCVPVTDDDSNMKSITANFLSGVGIPKDQIYSIDEALTEKLSEETDGAATTEAIAAKYEETMRSVLKSSGESLDLAVLGFGPDGHTCSLFPGHELLALPSGKWVASIVDSPKPPPRRITLTLDFLNEHTNHAIVCGAGASKQPIIDEVFLLNDGDWKADDATCQKVLTELASPPPYPCSMVTPKQSLSW